MPDREGIEAWPCAKFGRSRCGRGDLNSHPLGDRDLNPARLPVPPRPRGNERSEQHGGLAAQGGGRAVVFGDVAQPFES